MSTPKKSLGQHFLMHPQIARRIVSAAGVTQKDTVLEIGPGTGMLTRVLLEKAKRVVAIEADSELVGRLEEEFKEDLKVGKLELLRQDIRSFKTGSIEESYMVVANIPYYITGEILRQFLTASHKPNFMTLLVQKEVAERIARSKKESLLSISVKAYGTPKYQFTVPRGAFTPAPNVDSAVLSIENISSPFANDAEESRFFALLHKGFGHKRKQLAKNLESILPIATTHQFLEKKALSPTIRAEDLPLSVWKSLLLFCE